MTPKCASRAQTASTVSITFSSRGRNRRGREFAADDARRHQQGAVALAEIVDLSIDEARHVVRDREQPRSGFPARALEQLAPPSRAPALLHLSGAQSRFYEYTP
jgi:hypothetical protein